MRSRRTLLSLFVVVLLTLAAACCPPAKGALETTWELREVLIYEHDGLTDDQKRNMVHMQAAGLEVEPEEVEAELTERLGPMPEEGEEEEGGGDE